MNRIIQLFSIEASFRAQLFAAFTAGLLLLALTASFTTAWLTHRQAKEQLLAQGQQITATLAEQSLLALLYGSGENARDAATATLAFPDVRRVRITDTENRTLLDLSNPGTPVSAPPSTNGPKAGYRESSDAWHFLAPVFSRSANEDTTLYQEDLGTPELLGHAYVEISKKNLEKMRATVLANNLLTALVIAALLAGALNLLLQRLTRPLDKLSRTMSRVEEEQEHIHAELEGPKEITRMAAVFNRMMGTLEERDRQLRRHNETLESRVQLRTQELVQARDAALSASRHKSEFLANMSHELRTPLQAIIGYADILREDLEPQGDDTLITDVSSIANNARHLLSMINNILDMAKIEAGRMELKKERADLPLLAERAVETVMPLMRENGNRCTLHCEPLPANLQLDQGKVTQILLNLLSNAAKFTDHGEVGVTIAQRGDRIVIEVKDSGVGIAPEMHERIFEEFRQADGSTTRSFEGTGLGLAITRQLCRLMGGDIGVESAPGEGALFTVALPVSAEALL